MQGLGISYRNIPQNYGGELGDPNQFSGARRYGASTFGNSTPRIFDSPIVSRDYSPPMTYSPVPSYSRGGGTLKLDNVFNTSTAILSQLLARSGNPTTQLTNSRDITGITTPTAPQPYYPQQQLAVAPQPGQYPNDGSPGAAVGTGINGIINYALANPLYIFLVIGAGYLLFREPPKSRR